MKKTARIVKNVEVQIMSERELKEKSVAVERPTVAWYLAPIFFGVIGSAIMWYVLKDEEHIDSPKMIRKGWVIGIALTLLSLLWLPIIMMPMMIPMMFY